MKRFASKKKQQAAEKEQEEEEEHRKADAQYQKKKRAEDLRGRHPARPTDPSKAMEIGLYRAMEPGLFDEN